MEQHINGGWLRDQFAPEYLLRQAPALRKETWWDFAQLFPPLYDCGKHCVPAGSLISKGRRDYHSHIQLGADWWASPGKDDMRRLLHPVHAMEWLLQTGKNEAEVNREATKGERCRYRRCTSLSSFIRLLEHPNWCNRNHPPEMQNSHHWAGKALDEVTTCRR